MKQSQILRIYYIYILGTNYLQQFFDTYIKIFDYIATQQKWMQGH